MSGVPPSEIKTGVSNGDVDWLFRGKSKKLEKQLNSEKRTSTSACADRTEPLEKDPVPKATSTANPETPAKTASASHSVSPSTESKEHEDIRLPVMPSTKGNTSEAMPHTNAASSSTGEPPGTGSSRSSAPQLPKQPILLQSLASRRRSSMNLLPPSSAALSNAQASKPPLLQQQPPLDSLNSLQSLSRSNSSKSRSFFSFLSSKFKLLSFAAPLSSPTPSSSTSANHNGRSVSLMLTATSESDLPKTASNIGHIDRDQDVEPLKQPPSEAGLSVISTSKSTRRSSLTPVSPRLSVEKDRGRFFRRKSLGSETMASTGSVPQSNGHKDKKELLSQHAKKPCKLTHQLRRVSFALDKLDDDPQQQIPSRRPRKGNVLIPEDLKAPPPRLALGIFTTDGNRSSSATEPKYTEPEMHLSVDAQTRALLEAEKHAMEAHLSAKRLAHQISSYKCSNKTAMANVNEDEVSAGAGKIEIDNPLHYHESHFEDVTSDVSEDAKEDASPETVYTRCCHLREILPIPATLKQLKHKTRPLQILKMLNPKPTLIDVLSFSDFIAITPINTVIFDNVTMTTEMLKHLLAGLVHNKFLEKLSLRNVAIDEDGWGYLCEFLVRNQTVKKLDVSQQKVKQLTAPTSYRTCMNWDLFIESLKCRNGIEELVMGGCKLKDDVFESLLEYALTTSTCRLGVAATEINVRKCELLADWISRPSSKCIGLDIAYNDLSQGQLKPFIDAFSTKEVNLVFFSLNSTALTDVEEVGELLKGLTRLKNLRFFDFSSLPQLFPHVISKLGKYLPRFQSLRRVHFDLNELTSQSIAALADVFPKVQNLVHVSLLGNKNLDRGSIGALYIAVKSSSLFTLDLNYDLVPEELSQRLALYLMRNFDKFVKPNIHDYSGDNEQDDVMFDGSLLMETAEKMLMESDQKPGAVDLKLQRIITNALIKRTNSVRKEMHHVIDTLFEKRNNGNLSFEGKENLLRFCLLDASLEKLVHIFEQKAEMYSATPLSQSPSIKESDNILETVEADREQLHAGSSALIDAGSILMAGTSRSSTATAFQGHESTLQPHLVVIDANPDGHNVIVDNLTGRPILMRSVSQMSMHAREQEEEEGEFLRWGYFMEHRTSKGMLPEAEECKQEVSVFGVVPSGSELREAIMDAKGVESVTDLISKINSQRVSLDNIYNGKGLNHRAGTSTGMIMGEEEAAASPSMMRRSKFDLPSDSREKPASDDDNVSIDSSEGRDVHPVVDEAYDRLLNEAQRVISNK